MDRRSDPEAFFMKSWAYGGLVGVVLGGLFHLLWHEALQVSWSLSGLLQGEIPEHVVIFFFTVLSFGSIGAVAGFEWGKYQGMSH
jgi:hypothetical protein